MKKIKSKSSWIALWAGLALFSPMVQAQDQGLGDMMFTAGTVTTVGGGDEWAWLQWMATDSAQIKDRAMDIYLKPGDATSTNAFALKGTAQQVTDPRSIALLLARGERLGENLTNLESAVDSLYSGARPAASLTLAEKLASLISGSQDDSELYNNLVFMGRAHPAVSMVIGQGFACKIPGTGYSTFEVRDHNTSEIIGRITLQAGSPEVLPAPGPLLQIMDDSPMGNLNVRLRWDIPDALKRVSLLQFGYNLYRMPKAYAEDPARRYDLNPPSHNAIAGMVDGTNVVKVNRMPIVIDAATAAADAYFVIDDNDWEAGGSQFADGAQYYYFVSALDLLGRDGDLSDGLLASPFDRMAPGVPHGLRARAVSGYSGGARSQWIELSWNHDINDPDVAAYYVYRYRSIAEMQSNAVYAVSNRLSGAIVPGPAETRIKYEDHSLGSNDWSTTYWYTVRSEDASAGGANLSGNSAPAFAVLRDWVGPPPATGVVATIQVESLHCDFDYVGKPNLEAPDNILLSCSRPEKGSRIAWAEFSYYRGEYQGTGSETNAILLGRYYFRGDERLVSQPFALDISGESRDCTIFCRVGSQSGKTSNYAFREQYVSDDELVFKGEDSLVTSSVGSAPGPHVWGEYPITYPVVTIPAVEGAESYRLYRRVDGGPRTLVSQGAMDEALGAVITVLSGGSVNGGTVCYYYQLFDEHGNPGPMVKICCFEVEPRVDLPTPVLKSIEPTGIATNDPGMELEWFCTTPGVERFELALAVDDGPLPSTIGTRSYALQGGQTNVMDVVVGGVTNSMAFGFYRTGRAGTTFGTPGSPLFVLDSGIEMDRDYTIMVRAVGVTGAVGEWSNVETFHWNTVPDTGPQVPWPARDLPVVQKTEFHADFGAEFLDDSTYQNLYGQDRVGIRIGEMPEEALGDQRKPYEIPLSDVYDPMDYLYTNAYNNVETVMPCVLYRYQVTNSLYHTVSGDVAQVSPMMENIAYGKTDVTTIYDPFIVMTREIDSGDPWGIYLIDTQPVVRGASYQYLFMHFDEETKEPDRIIPAGTVTIP